MIILLAGLNKRVVFSLRQHIRSVSLLTPYSVERLRKFAHVMKKKKWLTPLVICID